MNQEMRKIRLGIIGNRGAVFEGNEGVVFARVDHFSAGQLLLDQRTEAKRNIQAKILFEKAMRPDCSGVITAMPGVNHDAADFQAELSR